MAVRLDISQAFPTTGANGYHQHLVELRDYEVSGVYAILEKRGTVMYIGESHSGRLYDTITRHFRAWEIDPRQDSQGRRMGGMMYDRKKTRVVYLITAPGEAQAVQYEEIQRLRPQDNTNDGTATEPPF